MDKPTTVARVKMLGATAERPAITDDEVGLIVDQYALVDLNGNAPSATDWTPTYDVNGAVAEVWRVKAGRVAGDYSFSADGASYSKADVMAHCLEMEAKFAGMSKGGGFGSVQVTPTNGPFNILDRIADRVIP